MGRGGGGEEREREGGAFSSIFFIFLHHLQLRSSHGKTLEKSIVPFKLKSLYNDKIE